MLKKTGARVLLSKSISINSLSFYVTILVNSAYLHKCHKCKPDKCFILFLLENFANIDFPLTGGSQRRSAIVITERPANHKYFSQSWINICPQIIWDHKTFFPIIKNFTSDNLFLKLAVDLSFKPSSFIPVSIPRLELMVVPPMFTADVL